MPFSTKYWDGYSQRGADQLRALDLLGLPYSKKILDGVTARRKGQFSEVNVEEDDPYVWGYCLRDDYSVLGMRLNLESGYAAREMFGKSINYGAPRNLVELARVIYVGDNYIFQLLCDRTPTDPAAIFWPTLLRADGQGQEHLSTEPPPAHASVSFYDTARLAGLGTARNGAVLDGLGNVVGISIGSGGHSFAPFATGWADDTTRYHFGMTALYFTDPTNPTTTKVPVAFAGNTGTLSMAQKAYPYFSGRDHTPFMSFVAGPGVVHALNSVVEDATMPQVAPYLATSNDHGNTWNYAVANFLTTLLYQHPADGTHPRAYYDNNQLYFMTRYATFIYVGNGVTLLFVPNAYVDGSMELGTARFCPALFVGTNGSYTRQAWPADTWYTTSQGYKVDPAGASVCLFGYPYMRLGPFGTGPGHAYIPIFQSGAYAALVTKDYGVTWNTTSPVPAAIVSPVTGSFNGVVTEAYKDDQHPEHIVFPAPNYATNTLQFLETRDMLTTFKQVAAPVKRVISPYVLADDENYCFVNYGNKQHKPAIFPAYPGEFGQPKG